MVVSYKGLWHLLIDKDMNKTALCKVADISNSTMAKMTRGEEVSLSVLMRICQCLDCDIGDIVEIDRKEK